MAKQFTDLTPFERFQMKQYGNILGRDNGIDETPEPEDRRSMQEENYIFELENPET